MKKWRIDRIISVATLVSSVLAIVLVLKKPQPVAAPLPAAVAASKADSFQQKLQELDQPKQPGESPAEVRVSSDEISAAIAQAAGAIPLSSQLTSLPSSPDAAVAPGQPDVKDYQVSFDG